MLVLFVAAGCGSSDDDGAQENAPGEAERPEREEGGIGAELEAARADSPDGLLPVDVALDLFASIYGDVPGGEARFDEVRPGDPSLTLSAVGARWDELDDETRAAIDERLRSDNTEGRGASDEPRALVARAFARAAGDPDDSTREADLTAEAERLADEFTQRLGLELRGPMRIEFVPDSVFRAEYEDDETTPFADAAPMRGDLVAWEGDFDSCRMRFSERRFNEAHDVSDALLAHEVFHCFEFEMAPLEVFFEVPAWVREGGAEWAAATAVGVDDDLTGQFIAWQETNASLYTLDYPALGYFWTVETMGIDPWAEIPRMIASGNRGHDLHHPVLDPKELASRLGTGAFMKSDDGASVDDIWDLTPEAVPRVSRASRTVSRGSPEEASREAPDFSRTPDIQINVDGDALDVELTGEIGAIQEVGGDLETFEGEFRKRFCFEEGSAHVVFMNLAFVDSGDLSLSLSVPNDDDACEEEEEECPDVTFPELPFTLTSENVNAEGCSGYRVYAVPPFGPGDALGVDWDWVSDPAFAAGFIEPPFIPCADENPSSTCIEETFADGSGHLEGDLAVGTCSADSGRPGADSGWYTGIFGESEYQVDGGVLHVSVLGGNGGESNCGATTDDRDITGEGRATWEELVPAARQLLTEVRTGP